MISVIFYFIGTNNITNKPTDSTPNILVDVCVQTRVVSIHSTLYPPIVITVQRSLSLFEIRCSILT
jgi:hypothetical protein